MDVVLERFVVLDGVFESLEAVFRPFLIVKPAMGNSLVEAGIEVALPIFHHRQSLGQKAVIREYRRN